MTYRKLRIAWSVAWGVVAVLLCVLWVRSYWSMANVGIRNGRAALVVGVERGSIHLIKRSTGDFAWYSQEGAVGYVYLEEGRHNPFDIVASANALYHVQDLWLYIPCWFVCVVLAILAAIPWITCLHHFGLRTLLIATTFVAVELGVIVWASK